MTAEDTNSLEPNETIAASNGVLGDISAVFEARASLEEASAESQQAERALQQFFSDLPDGMIVWHRFNKPQPHLYRIPDHDLYYKESYAVESCLASSVHPLHDRLRFIDNGTAVDVSEVSDIVEATLRPVAEMRGEPRPFPTNFRGQPKT